MISSIHESVEVFVQPYIMPLVSLGLLLISLVLCIHSLFSRRFLLWIIPFLLTLGLGVITFIVLLPMISKSAPVLSIGFQGNPIGLCLFDALYLLMIISFKSALMGDKVRRNTRRSRNEYEYLKSKNRKEMSLDDF